jgi:hypothetical protein
MTQAMFDDQSGQQGAAASFHFIGGYDQGYASTVGSDSIETLLFHFATANGAAAFAREAPQTGLITDLDHAQGTVQTIPGSTQISSTKPGSDGLYVHQILAQKDTYFMAMEYATPAAGPLPKFVSDFATQQYATL